MDTTDSRVERIRKLNDDTRRFLVEGGVHVTAGISAFSADDQAAILQHVCSFDDFTADNDPWGEHDFGAFDFKGVRIFWKIDAYDYTLCNHSFDATDPALTSRVLTIMRAAGRDTIKTHIF